MRLAFATVAFVLALAGLNPAFAQIDSSVLPAITHHRGVFNGQTVNYTATVSATVIHDDAGLPTVRFVTTSYVREGEDASQRPVLFLFNGGPSSSSATLHMVGLGPKRIAITQDPTRPAPEPSRLVDNAQTVLDVVDLVFIDPPETGFSRAMPSGSIDSLYSTEGDSKAVAQFIENWCRDNFRQSSPKFVLGESYGTIRAALMASQLASNTPLDGVFLFGQATNIVETTQRARNALGYAANLPALAAVAAYHGKVNLKDKSLAEFIDRAYAWGMSNYLSALIKGRDLPLAARKKIALELQQLTGIGADYYLAHDLIITKVDFARELLKSKGLIVATYDARYTGPAPKAGERAADPFAKVSAATLPMLLNYLSTDLEVKLPGDEYRDSAPGSGQRWKYTPTGGAGGPFWDYDYPSALNKAFEANPKFRLVIGTGIYDLTTTVGPARYMVAKSSWPADRVFLRQYEGGHMAYTNESARKAFAADIRAWVTGAELPMPPAKAKTKTKAK